MSHSSSPNERDATRLEELLDAESASDRPSDAPPSDLSAASLDAAESASEEERGEPSEAQYGRIGYGRLASYTPAALAVLLMVVLVAAALLGQEDDSNESETNQPLADVIPTARMGQPAPDVTITLFDGSTLRLAELRGSVVVLNFWASWCAPCREEMPALEAVSVAPPAVGVPVAFIGLAVKSDTEADARAFAQDMGVSYPTGRDGGTDNSPTGPIQRAFAVGDFVPTTVFIAPDGTIAMVHLGPLDEEMIQFSIEHAATASVETPAV